MEEERQIPEVTFQMLDEAPKPDRQKAPDEKVLKLGPKRKFTQKKLKKSKTSKNPLAD